MNQSLCKVVRVALLLVMLAAAGVQMGASAGAVSAVPSDAAVAVDPAAAQAAVDPVVDHVKAVLGDSLTAISVNLGDQTVHAVVHDPAPAALAALNSLPPGQVIVTSAAHSRADLAAVQDDLSHSAAAWYQQGLDIRRIEIASDGVLELGVASDTASAQAAMDAKYGAGFIRVVHDDTTVHLDTYRYDDVAPWNGGGFIYQRGGGNCTGGTPVHDSSGTEYIVTAAHCVGDSSVSFRNGYINDTTRGEVGSKTIMGPLAHVDCICGSTYPSDEALIQTNASVVDFNACWNCQGRATQEGRKDNIVGDQACIDGAFEGQRCGVVIKAQDVDICVSGTCRGHVAYGWRDDHAFAGGEGDSGAPVYAYDPANNKVQILGMYDFHNPDSVVACPSGAPNYGYRECGYKVYWIEEYYVLNHLGVSLNVG